MTDPLSTRFANAQPGEERGLLEELFFARFPTEHTWPTDDWRARFTAMLACGAYLSAVEMLVQPGYFWSITMRGTNRGGFHACYLREGNMDWIEAATAAFALGSAIAKALEAQDA